MKFLIPLAGNSEDLFPRADYHFPKPLIEVDGLPMIERVIQNLRAADPQAHFVFIVRREDCVGYSLDSVLKIATCDRCTIVQISKPTAGAACSALLAIEHIDPDEPLVICNGDQVIGGLASNLLDDFKNRGLDAGVITFASIHPRWSYVREGDDHLIVEAAEKRVISRRAVAGFYYFSKGSAFIDAAKESIRNGRSESGAYYVAPTLNEIILAGGRVGYFDITPERYHSFYSPQRIEHFERRRKGESNASRTSTGSLAQTVAIVIPMAGLGSRFSKAGYDRPKPFIDVGGEPMIQRVMANLETDNVRYVLLARREHLDAEKELVGKLRRRGNVEFVTVDKVTEGAACTVLLARPHLNPNDPLLIANCDQIVDFDCRHFLADCRQRGLDGSILVFKDRFRDPKWSFVRLGPTGLAIEAKEKEPISDLATVGLYYFNKAQDYIDAAIDMISRNERVNDEFYVCPVYNYAVANGRRIGVYEIPAVAMHGIGTPEDLHEFLRVRYQ